MHSSTTTPSHTSPKTTTTSIPRTKPITSHAPSPTSHSSSASVSTTSHPPSTSPPVNRKHYWILIGIGAGLLVLIIILLIINICVCQVSFLSNCVNTHFRETEDLRRTSSTKRRRKCNSSVSLYCNLLWIYLFELYLCSLYTCTSNKVSCLQLVELVAIESYYNYLKQSIR